MNQMTPPDARIAIHCERLSVQGDGRPVLDAITLAVPRGAVVGLVGRNGAGKSTLLRCLVGLTAPGAGASSLLGCPSLALTDAVRGRLGYVAQTPDLFDWMTVHEHLETIGRAYPTWNDERILILAGRLGLQLGQSVRKLSGGDQQKLAVVLALAHAPDLLILDEPVSSLDPMTRREFMRALFIEHDADDGAPASAPTIVISSHLLGDLERVASHIAFLHDGRLQLFDSWDAMLEHYRLLPLAAADGFADAVVFRNRSQCLVDARRAPRAADSGHIGSLDALFVALNS
jgi:ABC-2 type transport system ATP-binding protein